MLSLVGNDVAYTSIYQLTQCNIPEDSDLQQHCCENLKPCIVEYTRCIQPILSQTSGILYTSSFSGLVVHYSLDWRTFHLWRGLRKEMSNPVPGFSCLIHHLNKFQGGTATRIFEIDIYSLVQCYTILSCKQINGHTTKYISGSPLN
jgi:hypothetical protein